MNFVLDTSVTLSWCFADEFTYEAKILLDRLATETAYVPVLWTFEVGNSLLCAKRRKRISQADISQFLTLIETLDIQIDYETSKKSLHETLYLADTEGLTTYDAAYLELAMRYGVALATKDKQLSEAAIRIGVETINI